MEWVTIKSSMFTNCAYEGDSLYIRFNNGDEYSYAHVPHKLYLEFLQSTSKGKFFGERIKRVYADHKI